jgi:hypothetical protein
VLRWFIQLTSTAAASSCCCLLSLNSRFSFAYLSRCITCSSLMVFLVVSFLTKQSSSIQIHSCGRSVDPRLRSTSLLSFGFLVSIMALLHFVAGLRIVLIVVAHSRSLVVSSGINNRTSSSYRSIFRSPADSHTTLLTMWPSDRTSSCCGIHQEPTPVIDQHYRSSPVCLLL